MTPVPAVGVGDSVVCQGVVHVTFAANYIELTATRGRGPVSSCVCGCLSFLSRVIVTLNLTSLSTGAKLRSETVKDRHNETRQ